MCYNWKILVALVAVGVVLFFVLSPAQALAVAPLLLLALCPLSMIFMATTMKKKYVESEK